MWWWRWCFRFHRDWRCVYFSFLGGRKNNEVDSIVVFVVVPNPVCFPPSRCRFWRFFFLATWTLLKRDRSFTTTGHVVFKEWSWEVQSWSHIYSKRKNEVITNQSEKRWCHHQPIWKEMMSCRYKLKERVEQRTTHPSLETRTNDNPSIENLQTGTWHATRRVGETFKNNYGYTPRLEHRSSPTGARPKAKLAPTFYRTLKNLRKILYPVSLPGNSQLFRPFSKDPNLQKKVILSEKRSSQGRL